MKTIEFKSNYGNFAYRFTAEVGEDVNAASTALCIQGLANIAYRVAGSAVDKALGVKERKGVEFSDADGERINAAVSKKLNEMIVKDGVLSQLHLSFAVTGQHVFGEGAGGEPTKADKELWTSIQQMPGEKFEAAVKLIGIPEDYDDESALKAVRAWRLTEDRKALEESAARRKLALG